MIAVSTESLESSSSMMAESRSRNESIIAERSTILAESKS